LLGYVPERRETLNAYLAGKMQGLDISSEFIQRQKEEKEELKAKKKEARIQLKKNQTKEQLTEQEIVSEMRLLSLSLSL
jgi:hypothetical protein